MDTSRLARLVTGVAILAITAGPVSQAFASSKSKPKATRAK